MHLQTVPLAVFTSHVIPQRLAFWTKQLAHRTWHIGQLAKGSLLEHPQLWPIEPGLVYIKEHVWGGRTFNICHTDILGPPDVWLQRGPQGTACHWPRRHTLYKNRSQDCLRQYRRQPATKSQACMKTFLAGITPRTNQLITLKKILPCQIHLYLRTEL